MKEQYLKRLAAAKSSKEWGDICDEVKVHTKTLPTEERSGEYPRWWWTDVICSGVVRLHQCEMEVLGCDNSI